MLTLTETAKERFNAGIAEGAFNAPHLRVPIDHRAVRRPDQSYGTRSSL